MYLQRNTPSIIPAHNAEGYYGRQYKRKRTEDSSITLVMRIVRSKLFYQPIMTHVYYGRPHSTPKADSPRCLRQPLQKFPNLSVLFSKQIYYWDQYLAFYFIAQYLPSRFVELQTVCNFSIFLKQKLNLFQGIWVYLLVKKYL